MESNSSSNNIIIKPSQVLIEWDAPERVFKTKSREFYRKTGVIIIFFAILLLIIKEFLIIGVLGIVFFVVYVFHTVPPKVVHHKITTNGLDYASQHLYMWSELTSFYIERKDDTDFLILNTKNPIPGRILLLLDAKTNHSKLAEIINDYISIVEKPEVGMIEKFMNEASKKINF